MATAREIADSYIAGLNETFHRARPNEVDYEIELIELDLLRQDARRRSELRKMLGMKNGQNYSFVHNKRVHTVHLSDPMGRFYRELTLPFAALDAPQVDTLWETSKNGEPVKANHPIEKVSVFEVPVNVKYNDVRLRRIRDVQSLTLGFGYTSIHDILNLFNGMALNVMSLTISGKTEGNQGLQAIIHEIRPLLAGWPNLREFKAI